MNRDENIYSSISRVEEAEYYPVSAAQKRMYVLNMLEGDSTNYNMPGAVLIEGSLDRDKLDGRFMN